MKSKRTFTRKKSFDSRATLAVYSRKPKVTFNPLSTNPTKWSNTLKQFVGKLPTNCLSVFDHFVKLAFKGLTRNTHYFEFLQKCGGNKLQHILALHIRNTVHYYKLYYFSLGTESISIRDALNFRSFS